MKLYIVSRKFFLTHPSIRSNSFGDFGPVAENWLNSRLVTSYNLYYEMLWGSLFGGDE